MSSAKILIIFGVLTVLIPLSSFLVSQRIRQTSNTPTTDYNRTVTNTVSDASTNSDPLKSLLQNLQSTPSASQNSSANQTISGPTLQFSIALEARPASDQHTKLFVGIVQGSTAGQSPQYLISTSTDVPTSGVSNSVSLVGLNPGSTYTAVLKASNSIATSSAFFMTSDGAKLNNGDPIVLTVGDLNEDNIIDSADQTILNNSLGASSASKNWNPNLDFNADGVINLVDLGILNHNLGLIGATGKWYSTVQGAATSSASLNLPTNIGGEILGVGNPSSTPPPPPSSAGGYWLWVPSLGN